MAINLAIFGAFLIIVCFLGFFLWQTLFISKEDSGGAEPSEPAYSEQQSGHENTLGARPTPSHPNTVEESLANYTRWLAIFTLFLVLATVALFISGERNVDVAKKSANAAIKAVHITERQLGLMNKQTLAAERAATASRAYLFVEAVPIPQIFERSPGNYAVQLGFKIRNIASTPGIIKKIESHLFMSRTGHFLSEGPDPVGQEGIPLRETGQLTPIGTGPPSIIMKEDANRVIVAASSEIGPLTQTFVYGNWPTPVNAHGSWFYCKVTYLDIFNIERHTVYYIGFFGAGLTYPENDKYNWWD